MPFITYDLTGEGADLGTRDLTLGGVTLSLSGQQFEGTNGTPLQWNQSGKDVFNVVEGADLTRDALGMGVRSGTGDLETAIGGDTPDELLRFGFSQSVTIVSVDMTPVANTYSNNTTNQRYRLFTDSDANGTLDTVSGNSVTATVFTSRRSRFLCLTLAG